MREEASLASIVLGRCDWFGAAGEEEKFAGILNID
jgi:hypothetical protein